MDRIPEIYYTAGEARNVLGLTEHSFQYWVKTGKIRRVQLPGRKLGLYTKAEVDRLAHRIEAAILLDESAQYEYRTATVEDVDAENYLAYLNFGARANVPETRAARRRFIEVNPEVTHHLYDHGKLVASINLVPLTHEAILEFREGKRGWLFATECIEQFVPGKPLECIIIDFLTTPNAAPERRSRIASELLLNLAAITLPQWGQRGVEIVSLLACGGTDQGRRILDTAGFTLLGDRGNNRIIYELAIATSPIRLLRPYKEALQKWKETQVPSVAS